MTQFLAIRVDLVDFVDGTKGVGLYLPEEPIEALGLTTEEAARFLDAILRITKLAVSYNEARAHGAVGPTQ